MLYRLLPLIALTLLIGGSLEATSKRNAEKRIHRAEEIFKGQQSTPGTRIPAHLIRDAKGVIIVHQYKAGFIFGGKGGHGVVLARDPQTGKWSAPAFLKSGEGSLGLQIGGQALDTVYLVMDEEGMDLLEESGFRIGADASAAVGPSGRDAEAKIGPEISILAYSRARGLYVGASVEGGSLWNDLDANEAIYGEPLRSREILYGNSVEMPRAAEGLIKELEKAAEGERAQLPR